MEEIQTLQGVKWEIKGESFTLEELYSRGTDALKRLIKRDGLSADLAAVMDALVLQASLLKIARAGRDTHTTDIEEAAVEDALEGASDGQLIAELEERGFSIVHDDNELETLHDNFFRDPEHAVEAVRKWLLRATGRPGG